MNRARETQKSFSRKFFVSLGLMLIFGACHSGGPADASSPAPSTPATVRVTVPDAGWQLHVERVYELPQEIWILARLERRPGMAAQMITQAEAVVPVALPPKPQKIFVTGKTWAWKNDEALEFVPSFAPVLRDAESAKLLFPKGQ